ncbi:MAG: bifunctional DNA-formamidopyrimidine glycosylase/DNA-(apurinic or apyrimidinic site) lyase [Patescibacteria group bacterium]
MPELPEVETIRLGLQKYLVGKKLSEVEVRLPKVIVGGDVGDLVDRVVEKVRRFGKVLVLDFSTGLSLMVHIKLTGQLIVQVPRAAQVARVSREKVGTLPNRWTHLIFHFHDETKLFYNDLRQFGWIRVLPTKNVEHFKFIRELGPEPEIATRNKLTCNKLTKEKFAELLKNKNTKIKPLLLDQTKISGVGNIYSNDALFLAKIDPRRPAKTLSNDEAVRLYNALLEVLKKSLDLGGSSENTYVNALGEEGEYQKHMLVYAKAGKLCKNGCGNVIKRISLGGRGTFYCEKCQK